MAWEGFYKYVSVVWMNLYHKGTNISEETINKVKKKLLLKEVV